MQNMTEKMYVYFLIVCAILFQGILETLTDEMESSNLLIRNKRQVLSNYPHAIMRMTIQQIPYVVQIHEEDAYVCTGIVLSYTVILTAAHCVEGRKRYYVLSGSEYKWRGNHHVIERIIFHPEYHPNQYANDIALLKIKPEINIARSPNRLIKMHNGFTPPTTAGLISGWGCIGRGRDGEQFPSQLRSIVTSVISEERCRRIHKQHNENAPPITDRNICTMDTLEGSRCGNGDSGAPLVIADELVGVMSWSGDYIGPDVFVNLSHPAYRRWIFLHIPSHSNHY